MKKVLLIFLFCFGTLLAAENQIPRTYNVQLPILKEAKLERPEKNPPFNNYIRDVSVQLTINKKGKVEDILSVNKSDSLFVQYYESNIKKIKFEPAKVEGKRSEFKIVILLRFMPDNPIPDMIFPVDSLYAIDNQLYLESFKINNYNSPHIKSFPSYFSDIEFDDSATNYHYIILQVNIDANGKLLESKILQSKLPSFNWQIQSAVQWSNFSPMKIQDTRVESESYILISFFPYLSYPTKKWKLEAEQGRNILEKIQVRNLIDILGLLSPPVPAFYPPGKVTSPSLIRSYYDSTICLVNVDRSGKLRIKNIGTKNKKIRSIILKISKNMNMYPAIDYENNRVEYNGLIKFVLDGQGSVLIDYLWF